MRELRDLTQISLTMDGHAIECAEDGAAALEKLSANPAAFDLLITDHHMPKMNGVQLVTRLRELSFPGKIMVFSSELSREVNAAYRRLCVDKILFKPVFPATLRQVLEEIDYGTKVV
jgi:two-component system, chemotaxis family, chemotaxis protein CheY